MASQKLSPFPWHDISMDSHRLPKISPTAPVRIPRPKWQTGVLPFLFRTDTPFFHLILVNFLVGSKSIISNFPHPSRVPRLLAIRCISRRLDVEARFLGEVDVLGASLSSDLVLEACSSNWSETLCQSILDGMNKFDGYEKKSSSIGTERPLLFIHNEFPASA